jgi:hypothetical protein
MYSFPRIPISLYTNRGAVRRKRLKYQKVHAGSLHVLVSSYFDILVCKQGRGSNLVGNGRRHDPRAAYFGFDSPFEKRKRPLGLCKNQHGGQ